MPYFDQTFALPCKVFTREEIQAAYGSRSVRPIPSGYQPRSMSIRNRIDAQATKSGNKPWAVYAQYGDGKRVFISSHHSDTAAENKAELLNATLSKVSDFVYTIGERQPGKERSENDEST